MIIDDLSWHDGLLVEWRFIPDGTKPCVELVLWLYPEQVHSRKRQAVRVTCHNARRLVASCDIAELRDNAWAGNIVDGYRRGAILRLSVTGGFLEIEASSFAVVLSRRTEPPRTRRVGHRHSRRTR